MTPESRLEKGIQPGFFSPRNRSQSGHPGAGVLERETAGAPTGRQRQVHEGPSCSCPQPLGRPSQESGMGASVFR